MHIELVIYTSLVLLGLCLGSFAVATVWRLRARQLKDDKASGEKVDKKEYSRLKKIMNKSLLDDRSKCLSCGYILEWYDMIPGLSWLIFRGKCRKCHNKIGSMEFIAEIGLALYFVLSYVFWPSDLNSFLGVAQFVLWLLIGVIFTILLFYDKKWFLLPDSMNFLLIFLGFLMSVGVFFNSSDKVLALVSIVVSVLILSGLYLAIYVVSKGEWIGFGDIKLGLGLALILSDWQLAFVALFASNLIGCLVVLPGLISGKLKRTSHVPFGPFLIAGTVVAYLFGQYILNVLFIY